MDGMGGGGWQTFAEPDGFAEEGDHSVLVDLDRGGRCRKGSNDELVGWLVS